LEELGRFLVFFFWNRHIKLIGFTDSPTCNIGFQNFLLSFMSCRQIWLNPLVADRHFWFNIWENWKWKRLLGTDLIYNLEPQLHNFL
jgi:hypothetical protein